LVIGSILLAASQQHERCPASPYSPTLRETVTEAIAALPERLQLIVQLYFVEELNLSEIAEVLSVSVPRVHQLKAQALDKLKAALAGMAKIL
jgi:RNA polymerase sigma factor for flagellar operon FliA